MVHVSTPRPNIGSALGNALGGLGGQYAGQQYRKSQLEGVINQAEKAANDPNATPQSVLFSLIKAGAGIPGSERYIGPVYQTLWPILQARASQNVNYAGEGGQQQPGAPIARNREPVEPAPQRQQLPGFLGQEQTNKFFPNNIGPQEDTGNLPQAATSGVVRPVLNADQLLQEGKRIARERTASGLPTDVKAGYDIAKEINDENKVYNQSVNQETEARIASQQAAGQKGVTALTKLLPEATDEQKAIFQKISEDVAGKGTSEAEINRTIAKEATKFKNSIENIKKDLSASRLTNFIQRKFLGNEKTFNQAANDLRVKLKPLLDLGLYDTSRKLLTDLGYYPEERETVINPLSDKARTALKFVPEAKKIPKTEELRPFSIPSLTQPKEYGPNEIEKVKSGILDLSKADSNFSPVLARKEFEDKGYDWRIYKDAFNDLVQNEQLQLNDDQRNQSSFLDEPPLNNLDKILHGLKLIGR